MSWESRWLLSHSWMWLMSVLGLPTSHWTLLPLPCPWRLVEHVLLPCYALVKPHLSLPFASRKGQCFLQRHPEIDSDQVSNSVGHLANDL